MNNIRYMSGVVNALFSIEEARWFDSGWKRLYHSSVKMGTGVLGGLG